MTRPLDTYAFDPTRVEKPWGWELIWAVSERYVGKLLFVKAGQALSLQLHNEKDESWYVQEGKVEVQMGERGGELRTEIVGPGAAFRLRPGTVHRLSAIEDTLVLEVSTPQLDDIVRLEDLYGRADASR